MKHFIDFVTIISLIFSCLTGKAQVHKLNDTSLIACHNCYERTYSSSLYDVLNYITAIEIDIYNSESFFKRSNNDLNWYVRHGLIQKKGSNCCGAKGNFDSCLLQVKNWHNLNKDHNLIVVFIDLKQNWSYQHMPEDLDKSILKNFAVTDLFMPRDLLKIEGSLKQNVSALGWPLYNNLKNKILFAITGGSQLNPNKTLSNYLSKKQNQGVCFVCPLLKRVKRDREITLRGFDATMNQSIVIYNLKFKNKKLCNYIKPTNCLSRVFGLSNNKQINQDLKNLTNFIAVNNFKDID